MKTKNAGAGAMFMKRKSSGPGAVSFLGWLRSSYNLSTDLYVSSMSNFVQYFPNYKKWPNSLE